MEILRKIAALLKGNTSQPHLQTSPRNSASSSLFTRPVPMNLGMHSTVPSLQRLGDRLEDALKTSYMEQVQKRVIAKHSCSPQKYEWMLQEVKRYFILCAVYKNVPMYSDEADLIWHEMLMFTRDYEQFCVNFTGEFIHHQPNITETTTADREKERAMYDLLYSRFFIIHPENEQLCRPFFRHKLNPIGVDSHGEQTSGFMSDTPNLTTNFFLTEIKSRFRHTNDADIQHIQHELIQTLPSQIQEAENKSNLLYSNTNNANSYTTSNTASRPNQQSSRIRPNQVAADPILSLLLLSAAADHLFVPNPDEVMLEERKQQSGTNDSGTYTDPHSDKDDRTDSHHHDSSSSHSDGGSSGTDSSGGQSSCSSSSCGSSCGGGCSS
ncbi:hypothetical protein [Paenibacillus sp. Marseille-Q4541]|uniref:hypothetical protein n=1 Tax=Paenibacillus sp. Marseille-Q4541 TaxID=2831522 RepID=UPI001BA55E91|nr:hypothetical protein [Paenibacillus sp. Marseille-Q4541]